MRKWLEQAWCSMKFHGPLTFDKRIKGVRIIEIDQYGCFIKVKCDKCGKEFFY